MLSPIINSEPVDILLVTTDPNISIASDIYQIHTAENLRQSIFTLATTHCDVVILDETAAGDDSMESIQEIKRLYPYVQVLAWTKGWDAMIHNPMLEAGVDDFLINPILDDELRYRLPLILKRQQKNDLAARYDQSFFKMTSLASRLHSMDDETSLIREAIELACGAFNVHSIALALEAPGRLKLYAGNGSTGLHTATLDVDHPFYRMMETNTEAIFRHLDPTYRHAYLDFPYLRDAVSGLILPLDFQDCGRGALGIFGSSQHPLDFGDRGLYKLFANQVAVAFRNLRRQKIAGQANLLSDLQKIAAQRDMQATADTLAELVSAVAGVDRALVWFDTQAEPVFVTPDLELREAFEQLYSRGIVQKQIAGQTQPIYLELKRGHQNPLGPLFRVLHHHQMVVVPVVSGDDSIGGVLISPAVGSIMEADAVHRIEVLAYAAGQAVELSKAAGAKTQPPRSTENILNKINFALFSVDHQHSVTFCNAHFATFTGVAQEVIVNQPVDELVQLLAEASADADDTRYQLRRAIQHVQGGDNHTSLDLTLSSRPVHLELIGVDSPDSERGFIGILRESIRSHNNDLSAVVPAIMEQIRVPFIQVRSLVSSLAEEHYHFSQQELTLLLRQVEDHIEQLKYLWDNFQGLYSPDSKNREPVNLLDLVHDILDSRPLSKHYRRFSVRPARRQMQVMVDTAAIKQALTNILRATLDLAAGDGSVEISLDTSAERAQIEIHIEHSVASAEQIETALEPLAWGGHNMLNRGTVVGLYLSKGLINQQGGCFSFGSKTPHGLTIHVHLPLNGSEIQRINAVHNPDIPQRVEAEQPKPAAPANGGVAVRVPERGLQTIMVIEGQTAFLKSYAQKLTSRGYDLFTYTSSEIALRDLSLVRLDLILLDAKLPTRNSLEICERIRKHAETPIILVGDEVSPDETVKALNLGADDYITRPISDAEFMARLNVIFKRQRIPDRTREPLVIGDLQIDFARREVFLADKPVELTRIQYELLHTLAVNMGQVLTHQQLLEKVWGPEYQGETQYLWVNISRLRKKLEDNPSGVQYIHNVPGIGYMFKCT